MSQKNEFDYLVDETVADYECFDDTNELTDEEMDEIEEFYGDDNDPYDDGFEDNYDVYFPNEE